MPDPRRPIRYLKGVGPHRAGLLQALGIETVEDVCYYPPHRYEDRRRLLTIRELIPGAWATVRARVLARGLRRIRRGQSLVEAEVGDATGRLRCVWFHQPYLVQQLRVGDELILYGKVEGVRRLQLTHPELERCDADDERSLHMGRIVPIYPVVQGISQRWLRQLTAVALDAAAEALPESLPVPLRQAHGWPTLSEALRALHFPTSDDTLQQARARLAFEELLVLQLGLARRRARVKAVTKPQHYQLDGPLTDGLVRQLPFTLTASQQRAVTECLHDMAQPHPMRRLLQGDVGCGKTAVMLWLTAVAVQSGYQAAWMAPTELLAEQHARSVRASLGPLGVSVALWSQAVVARERRRQAVQLAEGTCAVAVGTHALLQAEVAFQRLALVVIDEQHKFGVLQRARLAKKADAPDVLILTATPIPRTLALSLYGDLSISTITELPPGRQPVTTRWYAEAQRPALYALLREELRRGRQAYVVYPLVQEHAARDVRAATQMATHLQAAVFPEMRVGLLHGQLRSVQKEQVMRRFTDGDLQLLVSTVIVEVGLDVPNATMMVIEHPERFGLAQLHQLRGRIGRGAHAATCAVVSDTTDETVRARLEAFVDTTDGFALAEKDLELRGPGELLGRRQHGWWRLRFASLTRDRQWLEAAREEAHAIIRQDPELLDPVLAVLRERLERLR